MRSDGNIPRELRDKVDQELEPGERIQWIDMPVPKFFTPLATAAFLFGIPWTAFAIFWTATAAWGIMRTVSEGPLWVFPLFGVPFILIGFGMLSSPRWAYRKALRTVYVLTNRRAITFDGGWSMTIRSYPPDKLQDVYRKEKKHGTGDVIIARSEWRDSDGDRRSEELGFIHIRNPREVERMLKRLAAQATVEED